MGTESKCTLRIGDESWAGTALLESDELLFRHAERGKLRVRIPLKDMRAVGAANGMLVVDVRNGRTIRLDLGSAADTWAAKMRSPPSRLKKLGVTGATEIALVGALDDAFVAEASAVAPTATPPRAALVFLAAESKAHLAKVEAIGAALRDDGALWVVYPKGQTHIREADVLTTGRAAGMKDVKVVKFSETHTARKFVRPLSARAR
jgi:hypothetical protein